MKYISVNDLPNTIFVQGKLVNNIGKIKLLNKKEKQALPPGSPDVVLKLISGSESNITRNDVINYCRLVDGSKIVFGGIRVGKEYIVCVKENLDVGVFHVPNKAGYKFTVICAGKDGKAKKRTLNTGQMVVYLVNNGKYDKRFPLILDKKTFDKMIVLLESTGKVKKRVEEERDKRSNSVGRKVASIKNNKNGFGKTKEAGVKGVSRQDKNIATIVAKAPYTVTGKIVKSGTFDNIIGYKVTDGKVVKALTTKQVMQLCSQHKINNMCVVKGEAGYYLRGVGIRIDTLETEYR